MTSSENNRIARRDFVLAAIAIATGLTVTGVSLLQLMVRDEPRQIAQIQTTRPNQSETANRPADTKPDGARPTMLPQEPALPPTAVGKSAPTIDAKQ